MGTKALISNDCNFLQMQALIKHFENSQTGCFLFIIHYVIVHRGPRKVKDFLGKGGAVE